MELLNARYKIGDAVRWGGGVSKVAIKNEDGTLPEWAKPETGTVQQVLFGVCADGFVPDKFPPDVSYVVEGNDRLYWISESALDQ